jgi:hypothetical protein
MKFLITTLCFYIIMLTVLPTVRLVKMHYALKSESACQKNNAESNNMPYGCQKEKCILNFNIGQFIINQIEFIFKKNYNFEVVSEQKLFFEKELISNYINTIWQPPEINSYLQKIKFYKFNK